MPSLVEAVVPPGTLGEVAQPVIRSEGLVLRPWAESDIPVLVGAYQDPDIQRWHLRMMTAGEALVWVHSWTGRWASEIACDWAVEIEGKVHGRIGLRLKLGEGFGEVGYWVLPAARGQGVAPKALAALSEWAFDEVGLHRLELQHSTQNVSSCRVAEKADYLLESTRRSSLLHVDGWHDMHVHVRIAGAAAAV
ncbi:N-acetyltransferase [Nakamurella silvestris]|nr:N-acetyltransferase [Nakamurella silvestris]